MEEFPIWEALPCSIRSHLTESQRSKLDQNKTSTSLLSRSSIIIKHLKSRRADWTSVPQWSHRATSSLRLKAPCIKLSPVKKSNKTSTTQVSEVLTMETSLSWRVVASTWSPAAGASVAGSTSRSIQMKQSISVTLIGSMARGSTRELNHQLCARRCSIS